MTIDRISVFTDFVVLSDLKFFSCWTLYYAI